jgi:hypothetical protein
MLFLVAEIDICKLAPEKQRLDGEFAGEIVTLAPIYAMIGV